MEQIIIRHGCCEGPLNPSLVDVERAMADIVSGRDQRPEFSIEYVSSWKREIVDGKDVVTCMTCEGRYITVARFYPDDKATPDGWFVLFRDGEDGHALALDNRSNCPFVQGSCCGGPLEVRANCIVPTSCVLEAVEPYLRARERCPLSTWLPEADAYPSE